MAAAYRSMWTLQCLVAVTAVHASETEPRPAPASAQAAAKGPLQVHPTNPRYFTNGSGQAILLTGSHTWGNLQDYTYEALPSPQPMDFSRVPGLLEAAQPQLLSPVGLGDLPES